MLAKQLHSPVYLITVIGGADAVSARWETAAVDAVLRPEDTDERVAEAEANLAQNAELLRRQGRDCTWEVLPGSPYFTIAVAVTAGDLIVMTSHGHSGIRRWMLGSVAEKLVREAPVPVILVPVFVRERDISGEVASLPSSVGVADTPESRP